MLEANVPSNILRKPPPCYFASFLIASSTPFNNTPESLRALTISKMSFISLFEIIKIVAPDPRGFFCLLQHLWLMHLL